MQNGNNSLGKKVGQAVLIILGIAVVLGILFAVGKAQDNAGKPSTIPGTITESDHQTGKLDSAVTLVEYSDFQCPACGAYAPLVEKLITEYGDRVRFVYRHFPIYSKHPNAEIGGRAAEAAGAQGKFFEYGSILFAKQDEWSVMPDPRDKLVEYAQSLGLNADDFKKYMNGNQSKASVTADYRGGVKSGVDSTPTFFLNGEELTATNSYSSFTKALDEALAATTTQTSDPSPSPDAADQE